MPSRALLDRLRAGEMLLLDGATGSELQRRGVNVAQGATAEKLGVWSATANLDVPEIVQQVHEDYLRLGVDIITSNNFWTSRPRLALIGGADEWETFTRAAGQLALRARDAVNPEAYVAGGIAPPGSGDLQREFVDQARLLAELGVDLLLAEYVGTIADCVTAVDACATAGRPVFLGVRHVTPEGLMQYGERFEDLAAALEGHPVAAILLMCSDPAAISASLPRLRSAWAGPIGAYANIGYRRNPAFGTPAGTTWHTIDQTTYPPARYAEFARVWKAQGAQIIGGCCATGPEHIRAIRPVVKGDAAGGGDR
jgi:S-methylmethionine-dependent homocysteine/selenocysteine methylase